MGRRVTRMRRNISLHPACVHSRSKIKSSLCVGVDGPCSGRTLSCPIRVSRISRSGSETSLFTSYALIVRTGEQSSPWKEADIDALPNVLEALPTAHPKVVTCSQQMNRPVGRRAYATAYTESQWLLDGWPGQEARDARGLPFCFSAAISVFAAGPEECGF